MKGLNIPNKFKNVVEIAKGKGIEISEVSVRSIMAKFLIGYPKSSGCKNWEA